MHYLCTAGKNVFSSSVTELCHCVESLQTLSGESFQHRLVNVEDRARLDVIANGFVNMVRKLILIPRCLILLLPHTVQYLYPSITGMRN